MDSLLRSSSLTSSIQFLSHQNPNNKYCHQRWPQAFSCRATSKKEEENENLYKVLSLNPKEAKPEDIKKSYRKMALRYHPDVCENPSMTREECTRMFLQVHEAYRTLSDPVLRKEYDVGLFLGMTRNSAGTARGSCRWREQLVELKRRSNLRVAHNKNMEE